LPPPAAFCLNHRLIFPDEHNPLCFTEEIVSDIFACGEFWALETVKACERSDERSLPTFYFVCWNILCGSEVHGHCQVTLTSRFAEGGVERLAHVQREYAARYEHDFFDDFVELHEALGLTVRRGEALVIPSLTPVKEREVWLLQKAEAPAHLPSDLLSLVRYVLKCLAVSAEAPCPAFNIGVAFPPLRPVPGWEAFPIVVRIVDRGWPMLGVCDWGTMEMYGSRIVATYPFTLATALT
jgi:hypothetical protein